MSRFTFASLDDTGNVPGDELGNAGGGSVTKAGVEATGVLATDLGGAAAAHAQGSHGRGGGDTFLNGLEISDNSTQQASHTFIFGPRTNTALAFPVATFQPKTTALVQSVDIAPSAGAAESGNNGQCWLDWCSAPVIDATTFNANTARIAVRGTQTTPTFAEFTSRTFGTNPKVPIGIAANYSGSGSYQIQITPIGGTAPAVIIGQDGSDVIIGKLAAVPAANTTGFLYVGITASGGPTGVPHYASDGAAVVVSQTATPAVNFYVNGAWWHATLTAGAA